MELLDVQKTDLEIDIAKLRVAARVQLTEEQIKVWLKQFCKGDLDDMEFRERIIDVFINSVYLYDDKTVIYYNIEGGKQVSYMEMLDSTEEPPFADDPQSSSGVRISNDTPRHRRRKLCSVYGDFFSIRWLTHAVVLYLYKLSRSPSLSARKRTHNASLAANFSCVPAPDIIHLEPILMLCNNFLIHDLIQTDRQSLLDLI